jgi:ADP-ribose pyrophosphatase YjhB (NUDIX family)
VTEAPPAQASAPSAAAAAQLPAKFVHELGTWKLRLQCFVVVRDAQRRAALLRVEGIDGWCLPGEQMRFNESPDEAAVRVARSWFESPVGMALERVVSFPATGGEDLGWYLVFVYDAEARGELKATSDTLEVAWVAPGETPPGPLAFAQRDVWQALSG